MKTGFTAALAISPRALLRLVGLVCSFLIAFVAGCALAAAIVAAIPIAP